MISVHPSDTTVALASPLNLTCIASGIPTPVYSWYKDGELVSGESRPYLYVSEVDPGDRGDYTFMAVNDNGVAVSNTASVHIPGMAVFK